MINIESVECVHALFKDVIGDNSASVQKTDWYHQAMGHFLNQFNWRIIVSHIDAILRHYGTVS